MMAFCKKKTYHHGLFIVLVILKTKSWKPAYYLKMCLFSRLALVSGLKWVDEVITDAPYAITETFLNRLFHEYNIDYVIHGDDPCLLPDGTDAYAAAKKAGRYKQIKRTEGVSSTDIVGTEFLYKSRSSVNCPHLLFDRYFLFGSVGPSVLLGEKWSCRKNILRVCS